MTLLLVGSNTYAQKRIELVQTIDNANGLSDHFVSDLAIDKNGFVWIATYNGLNCYNGDFVLSPKSPRDIQFTHTSARIKEIEFLNDKELFIKYVHKDKVVEVLDISSFQTRYIAVDRTNGLKGKFLACDLESYRGVSLMTLYNDSLLIYDLDEKDRWIQKHSIVKPDAFSLIEYELLRGEDSTYWVLNGKGGVLSVAPKKKVRIFPKGQFSDLSRSQPENEFDRILYKDRTGNIFCIFNTLAGIFQYSPGEQEFELVEGLDSVLFYTHIWEDQKGSLLFSAQTVASEVDQLFLKEGNQINDYSFLLEAEVKITSATGEDFTQLIHIGTLSGLKTITLSSSNIQRILSQDDLDIENGDWGYVIRGLVVDKDNRLYLSREVNHWYCYDPKTNIIDTIDLPDQKGNARQFHCSLGLYLDQEEKLWGCSCDGDRKRYYFHKYDPQTGEVKNYPSELLIFGFVKSKDGKFWLSTGYKHTETKTALVSFDPKTESFETYTNKDGTNPLEGRLPRYIYEDSKGMLWIGTLKGLVRVDRDNQVSQVYTTENSSSGGEAFPKHPEVMVINEDQQGNLLIGSRGGFQVFAPGKGVLASYDSKDGLCNNNVCGILPDEKNNLWISTFNGLSYFDRTNETFQNFDNSDGLSHYEFNRFSFTRAPDGKYYFGTVNGANSFYAEDLLRQDSTPSMNLTRLEYYDGRTDSLMTMVAGVNELSEIRLNPYVTYFQLHFALNDFSNAQRNQYMYLMEGVDQEWNFLGNNTSLRHNALPAGQYSLLIKGANRKGVWMKTPLKIDVIVEQVFYKTWWFLTLVGVATLGLICAVYMYNLRQAVHVERLRTKIASDLHDEVGSIMTRISMGADLLKEEVLDEEGQTKELKKIAMQSRQVTSIMSDVVWSIDARKDRVGDMLDRMREHLVEMLEPAEVQYKMIKVGISSDKKMTLTYRQNIYLIFKEAINNIVKHAQADRVEVMLRNYSTHFEMIIKDNGSGSLKNEKTGQGLTNMKMRAKRINAKLTIDKNNGYRIKLVTKPI